MKSCFVRLETAFITEKLSMKFVVMVADIEELRGRINGKGTLPRTALWRYAYLEQENENWLKKREKQAINP